jgi:hypothetical protein
MPPRLTPGGAGARFSFDFSLLHPLPADVRIEIQTSKDLGRTDPWHSVVSKIGPGAWSGAAVNESTPANGKVTATFTAPESHSVNVRQFYRFRLFDD